MKRKKAIKRAWVQTRLGTFYLEATDQGLSKLEFPSQKAKQKLHALPSDSKSLQQARKLLVDYAKGKKVSFLKLKLDLSGFTSFERRVLKALEHVKYGKVSTYSDLAKKSKSPKAARAVGSVMRKNRIPVLIPCHRVVRSGGELGGYSQGLAWKKRLLELEGR